jgi:hypothetical protein
MANARSAFVDRLAGGGTPIVAMQPHGDRPVLTRTG